MKYLIILFLLISGINRGFCQSDTAKYFSRLDFSPYGLPYASLASTETSQITFFDLNFITIRVQSFLEARLGFHLIDEPSLVKEVNLSSLTYKFQQSNVYVGTKIPKPMLIKYFFFTNSYGNPIISKCIIDGDDDSVIKFFVNYWPTTIHFDGNKKNGVFFSYFLQDKIELYQQVLKNYGKLSITNSTLNSTTDYEQHLKKNIAEFRVQQRKTDSVAKNKSALLSGDNYNRPNFTVSYPPNTLKSSIGVMYNDDAKLYDLINKMSNKLRKVKTKYAFACEIVLGISDKGELSLLHHSRELPDDWLNAINKELENQKTTPYMDKDGVTHESYKTYSLSFNLERVVFIEDHQDMDAASN